MILATRAKFALARGPWLATMTMRRLAGRGPITRVRRGGVTWILDLREGIDFAIWLLGRFEARTVAACARLVRPGDAVVDIGANMGAHTLFLARAVGDAGRVVAIEPTDSAFTRLERNVAENPALAPRIVLRRTILVGAASDRAPSALYASWPLAGSAAAHALHLGVRQSTAGATAAPLDDVLAEAGCGRVSLLKIDVDGAELAVLRGARETLTRYHPAIVMELAPDALADCGETVEAAVAPLVVEGYRFFDLAGRPLPMTPSALGRSMRRGASVNIVARAV